MLNFMQNINYFPFQVHLVVIRKCNLSCGYCNEFDKVSSPIPLKLLKKRVDKLQDLGSFFITFTGGEPFLHPHILDLIEYSRKRFFHRTVITNAYLLDEGKIKELNRIGLTGMQVSIDGAEPNSVTVKVLRPLRKKLLMLSKLARFKVNLNSVIGASTPKEVMEVVTFAKEMGFYCTIQMIHDTGGQIKIGSDERRSYEAVKDMIRPPAGNFMYGFTKKLIYDGKSDFKCRGGSRYLYIDEFGNVHWCSQTRNRFSKPLDSYTKKDLREQFYAKKGCESRCTVGCVRISSWFDEWRSYG